MKKYLHFLLLFSIVFIVPAQESQQNEELTTDIDFDKSGQIQRPIDTIQFPLFAKEYSPAISKNIGILEKAFASENPYSIHEGYRLLGYDYLAIEDNILAKESFEKSEKFAQLSKNDTAIALSYNDLGNYYRKAEKDYKKALSYHDLSIKLYIKINNVEGLSEAYYNTILSAMEAEDYRKVYGTIIKAKQLEDFQEDSASGIALDYYLGEYYAQKGEYQMADSYFVKAITAAEAENMTVELEKAYGYYYKSLQKQKKFKEAFNALLKYENFKAQNRDHIAYAERAALSAQFQIAEYRKDAKAAELQNKLQAEIANSRGQLNIFLIIVLSCFLLMIVALFWAYKKRRELVKELKIKNTEYLSAKEETERLSKAKSKFFSTISHELRTPLYGVIGLTTILLEDKSLKSHLKDLKSLKFSADYLLALINDVLQLNKIDSNSTQNELTSFNIRELIKKISSSFEYMRIQNNNEMHIHISDSVPQFIFGNSVRLAQVLMNLIGNACKFTEEGDIYIIAETTKNTPSKTAIKFYIRDTGIGIPAEKQERIFEEFSQLESHNYRYQGSGLGLPIVKKLLQLDNAEITLKSEPGKGSLFSFTLEFDVVEESPAEELHTFFDDSFLIGKRILVAEDNRINQMVTKKILEKNKMHCTIAANGQLAVEQVKKQKFDLILMDINMPVMNGINATQKIREFDPNIPILALTAVEVEEMRYSILDSGMNDIIVKPYDVTKFNQIISKHIMTASNPESHKERPELKAI
jgi:signal transduction histidine kinase/ActR/RegA family two-component response regulator